MKIALLSDIHANALALEQVIKHAKEQSVDQIWFVGDLLGYGGLALDAVKALKAVSDPDYWVIGNHDAYWAGLLFGSLVRPSAAKVLGCNDNELQTDEELYEWIQSSFDRAELKNPRTISNGTSSFQFILTHATLKEKWSSYVYPWTAPSDIEYFFPKDEEMFDTKKNVIVAFGHSHIPSLFYSDGKEWKRNLFEHYGEKIDLSENKISLINPGSVGQPRDGDTRAAYAVLEVDNDKAELQFFRVEYPVKQFALKTRKAWMKFGEDIDGEDAQHLQSEILHQTMTANGKRPGDDHPEKEKYIKLLERRKTRKGD